MFFLFQVKPKTKHTIHIFSHPQREKTRCHLVPTADGTYKLRHTISNEAHNFVFYDLDGNGGALISFTFTL